MPELTSLQNPRVKNAVRLRDRRHRERQGQILIDGARELRRAVASGVKLQELFVCRELCQTDDAKFLQAMPTPAGCEVFEVSAVVFERLAFGGRTEGVLGVAELPHPTLDSLLTDRGASCATAGLSSSASHKRLSQNNVGVFLQPPSPPLPQAGEGSNNWTTAKFPESTAGQASSGTPTRKLQNAPLVVVLEGVEKPGNIGAVLRSADAAGASAVIVADGRTDLFNPNAIRASLGTIFTVPVCEATSDAALAWLRAQEFTIFAARVDGSVPYTEADYRGPTAIVLGAEATGLSAAWTGDDIHAVRLPMLGIADSLNVSITGAVLFYEALRQRQSQ
jgi:tRNA G18 (ribose-2'-O)-methylase SpoU